MDRPGPTSYGRMVDAMCALVDEWPEEYQPWIMRPDRPPTRDLGPRKRTYPMLSWREFKACMEIEGIEDEAEVSGRAKRASGRLSQEKAPDGARARRNVMADEVVPDATEMRWPDHTEVMRLRELARQATPEQMNREMVSMRDLMREAGRIIDRLQADEQQRALITRNGEIVAVLYPVGAFR